MTPEEWADDVTRQAITHIKTGQPKTLADAASSLRSVVVGAFALAIKDERERCAKIAGEKRSFSPMPNPSDLDLGWKRCAAAIENEIRGS